MTDDQLHREVARMARELADKDRDPPKELPYPHPTRFVRYGPAPGDYWKPVYFLRQERDRD